jgi:hypothetical protein
VWAGVDGEAASGACSLGHNALTDLVVVGLDPNQRHRQFGPAISRSLHRTLTDEHALRLQPLRTVVFRDDSDVALAICSAFGTRADRLHGMIALPVEHTESMSGAALLVVTQLIKLVIRATQ